MDKKKIEILKRIQDLRDKNISPDFESLEKDGFERGILRTMVGEKLISFQGVFSLTTEGEKALRDYLMIENLNKKQNKKKIMFDNDILNKIAEGESHIDEFKNLDNFEFYVTHIQIDQINRCKDQEKRARISLILTKLRPIVIPTESGVWDISRFGEARFSDGKQLENLRKDNQKHTEDALIGETAIKNKIILVTNDKLLKKRVNSEMGNAMNLDEFEELLKNEK